MRIILGGGVLLPHPWAISSEACAKSQLEYAAPPLSLSPDARVYGKQAARVR